MAFKEIPNDANLERVNYSEFIETYSNSDDSYFEELSESTIERLLEIEHTPRISNHRDLQNSPVNNELNDNQETADVLTDESAEKTISRPSVPFANRQLLHEDSFSTNTIKWDSKASNSCRLSQDFVNSLSVTHHSEMEACDILSQDDCDVTQCCQTPHTNMALCQSLSAPACGDDMTSPSRPLVRGSQQVNHHRWSASQVTTFTNKYTNSDNEVSPELGEMMENLIHTHMLDASCQVDDDMALRADIVDTCDLSMMAVPLLVNTSSLTEPCQVTDVSMITDHTEPCQVTDVSMITDHPETLDYSMMAVPDVVNKLTMTDKKLVMDICSSMTPIKIAKQGQRLTADSVRQLHPRTLANQLDTLMTVNERLEKEVKSSVQEMVHLKAELRVVKSKLLDVEKQLELEKLGQSKHITMLEDLHEEATLGLQACIQEKQATIYNLEQELKCSQEKRKEAEVRLITLEQDLADKIETLQQLQAESKCHFETELVKLRRRYDESNSKRQLESSLQIIQELQAEKTELLEVFDDLERNVTLQFQLADGLFLLDKKVKGSAWKNRQEHEQLVFEFDNMKKKYNSQQEELENLSSENRELQVDIQNLSDILNRSNKCLVEMEVMYKNVNEELKESKDKVSYYSNELMATIQALEELTEKQDLLTQQLMELQDSRNKLSQALVQAEKKVFKLEQVHMEQEQLCDVSKQIENKKREDDELSKSKLEQHIENLLHTLDSLEVNKEVTEQELYELREQMLSDRIKMEEMASELDMLHKVLATFETEKEQVEELKHTIKMLEAEKKLCMEAIGDLRSQLETEVDLHKNNRRLVDSLQTNNSILQGSYQSLKSEARRLDETLSLKMLDIDASSTALSSLEDKMDLMLTNLQEKLGLEVTCEEDKKRSNNATQRKPNLSFQQGDSLVAFILSHVNTPSLQSPGNTSNMSGGNQSRQDPSREWINRPKQCNVSCDDLEPRARDGAPQGNGYGGREENEVNSTELGYPWDISGLDFTFSAIKTPARKSGTQKQGESEELSSSTPRFANIRRIPTTVDRVKDVTSRVTSDGQHRAAGTLFSDRDGSDSLLFKVKNVDRKFHHIEKLTEKAERTSKLTIADLTAEMDVLSNKVQFQKNHITQLESDLTKMTHLLNSKNTEIKDLCTRVKAMNESILNFHDQKLENKRLEEDKKELQYRVEDLRGQVALLTEQLDDFTKKLSYSREPDIISAREILSLKKKNHEGIMKLFMEREKNQELGEKAMRRMKILESNWQKAEAEVKKLDDLLEAVRQACIDSQCQSKVPIVLHIIRLLDGLV
ncbi:unnamed protein product [Lymnaea stagnalis]|uniref:Uncharacterized protein n=1 Tax=Lymnaea stagnalis TaxID=6523 RepID=A0AAV2HN89_LYMST